MTTEKRDGCASNSFGIHVLTIWCDLESDRSGPQRWNDTVIGVEVGYGHE